MSTNENNILPPLPTPDSDHYDSGVFFPVWKQGKMEAYARTAIEADRKRRGEPEGWKLVPVEPTPQMMDAGLYQSSADTDWTNLRQVWADMLAATPQPAEPDRGEPVAYPVRVGCVEGRLAKRPYQTGDNLPAVGSYCLISGANCDIESDQQRGYSWRQVLGYSDDKKFICLQTSGCWPTVERLTKCWFADIPHPMGVAPQPADPSGTSTLHNADSGAQNAIQATQTAEPAESSEPVGEAGPMPGTSGFSMACFKASEVPVGTKLYTAPQPVKCIGCEGKPAPENNPCAVCGKEAEPVKRKRRYAQGTALGEFGIIPMCDQVDDEPVKVPSDAELEKAWDSFEAEMARHPTDDELEEFMAQFADEMGHIHSDQHAEAARALLARYGKGTP